MSASTIAPKTQYKSAPVVFQFGKYKYNLSYREVQLAKGLCLASRCESSTIRNNNHSSYDSKKERNGRHYKGAQNEIEENHSSNNKRCNDNFHGGGYYQPMPLTLPVAM